MTERVSWPILAQLLAVCVAVGLAPNIILPALPQMASDFGVTYGVIQYAMSAYYAANGLLQLVMGPLADRFGRKPVLVAVLALYAIASIGCALSQTISTFFLFRTLQAVAFSGAVMCRAVARETHDERGAVIAISYIGITIAVTNMTGPALGGIIFAEFGWRANNLLTAVLAGLVLILMLWRLPETRTVSQSSIASQFRDFAVLMKSHEFWAHALVISFSAGTYFAYLGGIAIVAPEAFGLSPTVMGLLFGIMSLGYVGGSYSSGRLTRVFGSRELMLLGSVITTLAVAISLVLFLVGLGTVVTFYVFIFFVGFGYGSTIPNATVGLLSIGRRTMGSAGGFSGALMVFVGSVLVSVSGAATSAYRSAESLLWVQMGSAICGLLAVLTILLLHRRNGPRDDLYQQGK
ncbi:MFS transporter [Rhodobacterales bacterium HKCCE2091]|nr:MFS transporter [Rhodobacterales bacterium HKCCE2091]